MACKISTKFLPGHLVRFSKESGMSGLDMVYVVTEPNPDWKDDGLTWVPVIDDDGRKNAWVERNFEFAEVMTDNTYEEIMADQEALEKITNG